jgi:hypothetical protein
MLKRDLVLEPHRMLAKAELAVAEDGHTPLPPVRRQAFQARSKSGA